MKYWRLWNNMEFKDFKKGMCVKYSLRWNPEEYTIDEVTYVGKSTVSVKVVYCTENADFNVGRKHRITKTDLDNYKITHDYKLEKDIKDWIDDEV